MHPAHPDPNPSPRPRSSAGRVALGPVPPGDTGRGLAMQLGSAFAFVGGAHSTRQHRQWMRRVVECRRRILNATPPVRQAALIACLGEEDDRVRSWGALLLSEFGFACWAP